MSKHAIYDKRVTREDEMTNYESIVRIIDGFESMKYDGTQSLDDNKKLEELSLEDFNNGVKNSRIDMIDLSFEKNPEDGLFAEEADCYVIGNKQRLLNPRSKTFIIQKAPILYGKYVKGNIIK